MTLLIPIEVINIGIASVTWTSLTGSNHDLEKANHLNDLAMQNQIHITEMASAMKGYLLDPINQKEVQNKLIADEKASQTFTEMEKLSYDPEFRKLMDEAHDLDEKKLNPTENEIMDLVKQGKLEQARAAFKDHYLPVRELYNELSQAMIKKADEVTEREVLKVHSGMRASAIRIIFFLFSGGILTAIVLIWLVRRFTGSLNLVVEELGRSANDVTQSSSSVASASASLSSGATEQASALQETVTAIDEISSMVAKNAENANQSMTVSGECQDAAEKGKNSVNLMIHSMSEIQESNQAIMVQVESSNREMGDIIKVITEIGNKTKVINDIVFQTKLLSFNASVEAARAGEHGKGFAVVAEEVGNLAQMSGNAAKEITSMLEGNIQRVEQIVSSTQSKVENLIMQGKQKIEEGTRTAQSCGEILSEIVNRASNVNHLVQEITTASKEQAKGISEVTHSLNELDIVSQQNAGTAAECSGSAESLKQQADQLKKIVRSLVVTIQGTDEREKVA